MKTDPLATWKYLTLGRLRELLKKLPAEWIAVVNEVGNVSLYSWEGEEYVYKGFLDFLDDGQFERAEDQ